MRGYILRPVVVLGAYLENLKNIFSDVLGTGKIQPLKTYFKNYICIVGENIF